MAEADVSITSERVQRLLQCAVCLDRFKQPKLLPCQHTFCLSPCLEGLVEHRTRSLRCPECRADHFIPRSGVTSFPNNLTIIGFLSLSETSSSIDHPIADLGPPNESNDIAEVTQANERLPLASQDAVVDDRGCHVCHNQTMIQRCCHCERLVCEACHEEHLNLVTAELGRLVVAVRSGLPHITDQIMAGRRKGTQLQSRCENVKTEITEGIEKLIRDLRARERTLHEEVDSFFAGETRGMRTFQENAELKIASISSFCDSAEYSLGERRRIPTGDLMETKRQCEEYVETVQNYEDGSIRSPHVKQIEVSLESPFLSSAISNLGEVIISSRISRLMISRAGQGANINMPETSRLNLSGYRGLNEVSDDTGTVERDHGAPPHARHGQQLASAHSLGGLLSLQNGRLPQVTFDDDNNASSNEGGNWNTSLLHTNRSNPNRRSRQDRLSDSTAMNLMSGPTLSQRLADRRRHQSLGGLVADEYSVDAGMLLPDRHRDHDFYLDSDQNIGQARDGRVRDGANRNAYSSSFPGAQSLRLLHSSHHEDSNTRESRHDDFYDSGENLSLILNTNTTRRNVDIPRNRYNQKGNSVYQLGTRGSGPGELIWPRGLAVSHLDDRIYVTDSSNHRVQIFDSAGHFIKSFGSYGQNEGEFDCLAGIAISSLGQIVVSDRYNHRLQIFDRNGNFQASFGREGSGEGEMNYPWGVACDNMGFIYVCDKENHRVQVFQSNGTFVRTIGEQGNRIGQLENPHYVAVSQDNKVFVSDSSNHRIQVFSIYGDFLFSFGVAGSLRGQMKFPRGIAIDSQGFAIVADSGNNRIQVFRSDGRFYSMFGNWGSENGQFKGLEGVAVQANGHIVISDRENHRVQVF